MATITIEKGLEGLNIVVKTPQEALQALLDSMGYTTLLPIKDKKINDRLKTHSEKNINRSINDYDNI